MYLCLCVNVCVNVYVVCVHGGGLGTTVTGSMTSAFRPMCVRGVCECACGVCLCANVYVFVCACANVYVVCVYVYVSVSVYVYVYVYVCVVCV